MTSILRKTIYISTILFLLIFAYYAIVSMSESKRFSKYTLDFLLLTPSLIKNQPLKNVYNENYYYSAADGNKPTINSVTFFSKKNQADIHLAISEYLEALGYVNSKPNLYIKKNKEVSIEYIRSADENVSVILSVIEHIK